MEIYITTFLSIATIIITIVTTVYTVNKRVENEKRETHMPYIILEKVIALEDIDTRKYYLTFYGRNYSNLKIKPKQEKYLPIELLIKNIGYGVATNIKFYNLLTGNQIEGTQESHKEENQRLFTTLDAGVNEQKKIQAKVRGTILTKRKTTIEEHNRILCVYKDLNEHIYTSIFCINMKDEDNYDFFAYQPSSKSYKRWIKENKRQYKEILKKYSE